MRKRLRVRGTFAPGAVLLQGRAACRSTRVGCEGGNLGSWCLLGSHRAVRRSGGAPSGGASRFGFVGAPVAGAIWGGAFGRAGHAVRTGAVLLQGGRRVSGCRSTRPGCEGVSLPHHSGQGISLAVITSPSHPTTSIFFPFLSLISAARFGGR